MPLPGTDWSFFHPALLWGMATLAIPVLIHLFNRSRGRLVRIGHIDLIKGARKLKVTELKLAQWLLLLLRLALFALAALILAGLARQGLQSSQLDTAYVTPAWLHSAEPQQITDLLQRYSDTEQSRVFILQDGYPALDQAAVDSLQAEPFSQATVSNIWPLLSDRLSIQQHLGEVEVYAVDLLQQFGSEHPSLVRSVNWELNHPPAVDAVNFAKLKAVVAYDAQHRDDADIIRAALVSLKDYRLPGLSWDMLETESLTPAPVQGDWLIVLSDGGLDDSLFEHPAAPMTVLADAIIDNNPAEAPEAPIGDSEYLRLPFYPFSQFRISRLGNPVESLRSVLNNHEGQPVIQTGQRGNLRLVQYNSRFLPEWSSIAAQAEFPELLLQLMLNENQHLQTFAGARVLAGQLQAAQAPDSNLPLPRRSQQQILAALMIFLWLLERWLSERRVRRE